MRVEEIQYARGLEAGLRPLAATATAAAGGGRDSHGREVPGLDGRLEALPDDIRAIAAWVDSNAPSKPERRNRR